MSGRLISLRDQQCKRIAWLAASVSCVSFPMAHAQDRDVRTLEEVIVTAQKRDERLQDVPISISVLGGANLDRATLQGVTEALSRVPGVATTVATQGAGTLVGIRGVTAAAANFNGASPIAYYLDAVPFGFIKTATAPDMSAYDMERIEVLRGPQGTLYGASAQNGVVRVITKDANPEKFELKGRTSGSTTDQGGENYRADMAINVPIIEGKLAARATVGYEDWSGFIDRPTGEDVNDSQVRNMRLKVNAQPTEALSIGLSGWMTRTDFGAHPGGNDDLFNTSVVDEHGETDYEVYGLKLRYDFAAASLTATTGYLDYFNRGWLDYARFIRDTRLETLFQSRIVSEEIILSSSGEGNWKWSLGAMYRDAQDRLYQWRRQYPAPTDATDISESIAIFGEVTRLFGEGRFEVTGGLRYFEDDVTNRENVRHTGIAGEPLYRAEEKFHKVSPRVVLAWHPTKDATVYTSYAEGFRSGFHQYAPVIRAAPEFPPLEADNLKNYELGAKASIADGLFTFDAAVFYIDWQDVQQSLTVPFNNGIITAVINGTSASGPGAEFAIGTRPMEGLELSLNFGWNDLAWDSNVTSAGQVLFRPGDRVNLSPEYLAGASVDYSFGLGSSEYQGRFSVAANYSSEVVQHAIFGGLRIGESDDLLLGRTSFSVETPNKWTATLFVENVTNEDGAVQRTALGVDNWSQRVRPRTVGAQLEFRF